MNKLQETRNMWIKENEDHLLTCGLTIKMIESLANDIVKFSIEYARSKIPYYKEYKEVTFKLGDGGESINIIRNNDMANGFNSAIAEIEYDIMIDEDLLSLNENKDT